MVWPRAQFPKEWIIEEESEDSSDDGSSEEDYFGGESSEEAGGSGEEEEAEGDVDIGNLNFGNLNQDSEEIPFPCRANEKSETRVPLGKGWTMTDFFFSVISEEETITEWTANANKERAAHFLKQEALGVVHGDKVHGKSCPLIHSRELKGLLAIFLIMGVAHVRNIGDAYRLDANLRNEGIASIMSHARLKQVRTYLTCSWLVVRSSLKHLRLSLRNGNLGVAFGRYGVFLGFRP